MSVGPAARAGGGGEAYLLCGRGALAMLVPTGAIVHVEEAGTEAPGPESPEPLDLGTLPGIGTGTDGLALGPGHGIDVRLGPTTRRLKVDWIGRIEPVATDAFVEVPALFGLARRYFDAACIRPFGGAYPLRLDCTAAGTLLDCQLDDDPQ